MGIIGDVFGLSSIYERQVQNVDNNNFESWPESAAYGYFGGGATNPFPTLVCTIDRLDFFTEVASVPGNELSRERFGLAVVSNSNYGYFGGGNAPPVVNIIDRLDFSNETTSVPGNGISQARYYLAAVSNFNYGYFGGGLNSPSVLLCTINRLDFYTETTSLSGNGITQERYGLAAVSGGQSQRPKGSRTYGYFVGGSNDSSPPISSFSTIDRLDFFNETVSVPGPDLSQSRYGLAGISN